MKTDFPAENKRAISVHLRSSAASLRFFQQRGGKSDRRTPIAGIGSAW
jgi:hypothetical protein